MSGKNYRVRRSILNKFFEIERSFDDTIVYRIKKNFTPQKFWKLLRPELQEMRNSIVDDILKICEKNIDDPEGLVRDNERRIKLNIAPQKAMTYEVISLIAKLKDEEFNKC